MAPQLDLPAGVSVVLERRGRPSVEQSRRRSCPIGIAVDRRTLARMLVSGGAALSAVIGALVLAVPFTMVGSMARLRIAFSGNMFYAFALLVPQAMPIAIPAALVFGALWGVRQRPAPRSIQRTILLMGVCGSLVSATLLEWAIPRANQAFRVVVFQNGDHRTPPPAKGSNELTWRELGDRITRLQTLGPSAELRQMRLAYHGHIAFVTTPVIFSAARDWNTPATTNALVDIGRSIRPGRFRVVLRAVRFRSARGRRHAVPDHRRMDAERRSPCPGVRSRPLTSLRRLA